MQAALSLLAVLDATVYNSLGLLFVALGGLICIRFTGFPDLTIDGSFTMGAAVYAVLAKLGHDAHIALPLALVVGAASGALTALLNILGVGRIAAAISVYVLLIVLSPYVAGGATIGLLHMDGWLDSLQRVDLNFTRTVLPGAAFSLHLLFSLVVLCLYGLAASSAIAFFRSHAGVRVRYVGSSESPNLLSPAQRKLALLIGLSIGNAFVAMGGAIEAQRTGSFSQGMGVGVVLIAITVAVMAQGVSRLLWKVELMSVPRHVLAISIATVIYCLAVQLLLRSGITSQDVRLSNTILLVLLILAMRSKYSDPRGLF